MWPMVVGAWLIAASALFWIAWLQIPGVGVADAILYLVAYEMTAPDATPAPLIPVRTRLQGPDLETVLELEQRLGLRAVEREDVAVLGDVPGHGRSGDVQPGGRMAAHQLVFEVFHGSGHGRRRDAESEAQHGREDRRRTRP